MPVGRPFPKGVSGNPSGRPKGLPAAFFKFFTDGDEESGLPPQRERFIALLTCDDFAVRLRAEQLLLEHQHGKPAQNVDVTSNGETLAYFIEPSRPQTADEWLAAHAESQRAIAQADQGITEAPN